MGNSPVPQPAQPPAIGIAQPFQYAASARATFNPDYLERRPKMWALSKTDMMGISTLGMVATLCFSTAGFMVGRVVHIVLACVLNSTQDAGVNLLLHIAAGFLGAFAVLLLVGGLIATHQKSQFREQIEKETHVRPQP